MSYHYRCNSSKCRKRITLRKPVEQYVQQRFKKCPACGSNIHYDPQVKIDGKKGKCNCDGYHFPHRIGTGRCKHVDKFKAALKEDFDLATISKTNKIPF